MSVTKDLFKSKMRYNGILSVKKDLVAYIMLVALILNPLFLVISTDFAGADDVEPPAQKTFYFRDPGQLSEDAPFEAVHQVLTIPRSLPRNQWREVGTWSYVVPEERAGVQGVATYSYTVKNAAATPVPQLELNFTLKADNAVIEETVVTLRALAPGRARTYTASSNIPQTYLTRDKSLIVQLSARTPSNDLRFFYDSRFFDTALSIDYSEANFLPAVNAGNDVTVREGTMVDLQGTASDQDGNIVQYQWDFEGDGIFDWSSQRTGYTSHMYGIPGVFTATLKVTDDDNGTAEDSLVVTVNRNQIPTVTIDSPDDGQEVNGSIVITGTAHDSDGTIQDVWLSFDGGNWHRAVGTANWTAVWDTTLVVEGIHVISVRTNDSIDYSEVVSIQVLVNNSGVNPRPVCDIISILPNPAFKLDRVEFIGDGTDDGQIVTWRWTSSIDGVISSEQSFLSSNQPSLTPGNHTIYLRVKDNNGTWSDSVSEELVIWEYSRPHQITEDPNQDRHSSTINDEGGVFWSAWTSKRDGDWDIYVKSSINGVDWADIIKITNNSFSDTEPSMIQLANRTYVIAYASDVQGSYDIYVQYSRWGGYWSEPVRVTDSPLDEREPFIFQRSDGKIFLAYTVDEPAPVGSTIMIKKGNNIFTYPSTKTAVTGMPMNIQPVLTENTDGNISILFSSDRSGNYEIWETIFVNDFNFTTPRRISFTILDNYYPFIFKDSSSVYRLVYSDSNGDIHSWKSQDVVNFGDYEAINTEQENSVDSCLLQDGDGSYWLTWDSDDSGNWEVYSLTFAGNSPPHAIITSPIEGESYFTSDSIEFDGSDTYDPDGDEELDTYLWESDRSGELSTSVTFQQNLEEGMHNITLTVTDTKEASSRAEVTITVTMIPNSPPTADAGDDKSGKVNEDISFDGSASTDPDGDTLSYHWDFDGDGIWDDHNKTTTHAFEQVGTYYIALMVEDTSGANDTDNMTVTIVENLPPTALITIIDAGDPPLVNVNTTIDFDASSSSDPDDETLYYSWDFNGDGEEDSQSSDPSHKYTEPGVYTVTLTVTDPYEANATDSVEITINKPPVARMEGSETGYSGEEITFNGAASSDEDDDLLTYEWDFQSDGEIDGQGVEVTHIFEEAGEYIVVLWVFDGRGGKDTAELEIVIGVRNTHPVAHAGEDFMVNLDVEFQFNGTLSYDPDDDIGGNGKIDGDEVDNLTYSWNAGDSDMVTGIMAEHSYAKAGEFIAMLTVTDADGLEAHDNVTVTVNTPPEAALNLETTGDIFEDEQLSFSAADSSDADGDTLSYYWDFDSSDGASADLDPDSIKESPTHIYEEPGTFTVTLIVDDGRGGNSTISIDVVIKEIEEEVELDTPSITITDPDDGDKIASSVRKITVTCTAEGDFIDKLIVYLLKGDDEEYKKEFTSGFDEISVEINKPSQPGDYEIFVELISKDHSSYYAWASVNITVSQTIRPNTGGGDEETDEGVKLIPFLPAGAVAQYGSIAVVVVILILVIFFGVIRRKKRGNESDDEADEDIMEVEVVEAEPLEEEYEITPEDIRARMEPLTQIILCPECDNTFEVKDFGERPMVMECSCGAKGQVDTPVPDLLKVRMENIREELESELRGAHEKDGVKVKIRCPECQAAFNVKERTDIECPECSAKGDIPQSEFDRLVERAKKKDSPNDSSKDSQSDEGEGSADKRPDTSIDSSPEKTSSDDEDQSGSKDDKDEEEKDSDDDESGDSSTIKVECPKCSTEFQVDSSAKKIKCPSCGAKGKMG